MKRLTELSCAVQTGRIEPFVLRDSLAALLGSPDAEQALQWLSRNGRAFSQREVNDFHAEFIRLNPSHEWTRSERENLARETFRYRPRRERLAVYRQVVKSDGVREVEGFPINRAVALSMASWEGMTELEDEVTAHGSEIPSTTSAPVVPFSLWAMRLSKDAENYREALSLRARRLDEMPDDQLFRLMRDDPALRALVEQAGSSDCSPEGVRDREMGEVLDKACRHLQALVSRQETYVRRLEIDRDGVGGVRPAGLGSCIAEPTSWLQRLSYTTARHYRYEVTCPSRAPTPAS